MNPSANSTQEHTDSTWAAQSWDHPIASVCSGLDSRHFQASRLDWDWENQMILAQHPSACSDDQDGDRKPNLMGDTLGSGLRHYNALLTPSFGSTFPQNGWGVLNATGIRNGRTNMETSLQAFHATSDPIYAGLEMPGIGGLSMGNCALGARSCFENQNQLLGLDVCKQEICNPVDFTTRLGLNLGGRTYFSTEDSFLSRFGKRHRSNSPGVQTPLCQAEGCKADLSIAKHYHRRHKVCQFHSKAPTVTIAGQTQRFCQQCSRFHVLSEFDEGKRSCRKRLADHNRRRRKPQLHLPSTTGTSTPESSAQNIDEQGEKKPSNNQNTNGTPTKFLVNCEANSLPPPMSFAPNGPLMLQNGKTRLPILPVSRDKETQIPLLSGSHEKKPYQQFLQGPGHAGSSLSLSTLGRGTTSVTTQRQSSEQSFGELDVTVPWLRPINSRPSNFLETIARTTMNAVTGECSPHRQFLESGGHSSSMQALSHSIQNLLPLECNVKGHISDSDWMMKSLTARSSEAVLDFVSQNLDVAGKPETHDVLSLFERGTMKDVQSSEDQCLNILPMEFLQEHLPSTAENLNVVSDGNGHQAGIEFAGLQELRSFNQSSYNSTENVM